MPGTTGVYRMPSNEEGHTSTGCTYGKRNEEKTKPRFVGTIVNTCQSLELELGVWLGAVERSRGVKLIIR
jgi:hypothetical protein